MTRCPPFVEQKTIYDHWLDQTKVRGGYERQKLSAPPADATGIPSADAYLGESFAELVRLKLDNHSDAAVVKWISARVRTVLRRIAGIAEKANHTQQNDVVLERIDTLEAEIVVAGTLIRWFLIFRGELDLDSWTTRKGERIGRWGRQWH